MSNNFDDFPEGFEVFEPPRRRSDKPLITIQAKLGHFSLNAAALDALGHPARVLLSFAPRLQQMALQAADPTDRRAYTLIFQKGGTSAFITALNFSRHYGIAHGPHARPSEAELRATSAGPALVITVPTVEEQP